MNATTALMRDAVSFVEDKVSQTHTTARSAHCKRKMCGSLDMVSQNPTTEHTAHSNCRHVCREMDAPRSSTWGRRRQICFMRERNMGSNQGEGPTQSWPMCTNDVARFEQPDSANFCFFASIEKLHGASVP